MGDSENDIKQLRARRHALANKLAQQQKRRDKIQVKSGGTIVPEHKTSLLKVELPHSAFHYTKLLLYSALNKPCYCVHIVFFMYFDIYGIVGVS